MLTDENGLPVYKNGRYTLSENILKGLYLKNDNGILYYSYDGNTYTNTYRETPFTSDDLSHDMFGVNHGALTGTDATPAKVGGVVSRGENSYTVFLPRAESAYFTVSSFKENGSLNSSSTEEMQLSLGKNVIPLPERDESFDYKYMLWKADLTPLHSAVEYYAD